MNDTFVECEVYITNISGVTDINVVKREQIWLINEEYLWYCGNYWHSYALYIDISSMCKICSFQHKHFRSNWHKGDKERQNTAFWIFNIGHMTFIFELGIIYHAGQYACSKRRCFIKAFRSYDVNRQTDACEIITPIAIYSNEVMTSTSNNLDLVQNHGVKSVPYE